MIQILSNGEHPRENRPMKLLDFLFNSVVKKLKITKLNLKNFKKLKNFQTCLDQPREKLPIKR